MQHVICVCISRICHHITAYIGLRYLLLTLSRKNNNIHLADQPTNPNKLTNPQKTIELAANLQPNQLAKPNHPTTHPPNRAHHPIPSVSPSPSLRLSRGDLGDASAQSGLLDDGASQGGERLGQVSANSLGFAELFGCFGCFLGSLGFGFW